MYNKREGILVMVLTYPVAYRPIGRVVDKERVYTIIEIGSEHLKTKQNDSPGQQKTIPIWV